MCGRMTRKRPVAEYARHFDAAVTEDSPPSFNVAPSDDILAVTAEPDHSRHLVWLHWGLVPAWSKGPDSRFSMINARAETLADKPAYRTPYRKRRCLIVADGFYEWQQTAQGKQPYYITLADETPIAMAGLWDHWESKDGEQVISSATIITTGANTDMQAIHDRMPVILPEQAWSDWLDPANQDTATLASCLAPPEPGVIRFHPVATRVNSPTHDGPDLIAPIVLKEEPAAHE